MGQMHYIYLYEDKTPRTTHKYIASHFNKLWNTDISWHTVGDILAKKDKWVTLVDDDSKHVRGPKHEQMEKALYMWFIQIREKTPL